MKKLIAALPLLVATPALAHEGVHIHPHGTDPIWIPMLVMGVAIAALVRLARVRSR